MYNADQHHNKKCKKATAAKQENRGVGVMVFNATVNSISIISWWSGLLVEETTDRD